MKNKYMSNHGRSHWGHLWLMLVMLLALPGLVQAQSLSITPATPDNPQNFGSVAVGAFSASKTYTISGSGLGTDDVVIRIPSRYQGSVNNTAFSTSNIVFSPTGGAINATFYVRFAPTTTGTANRLLDATTTDVNGDPLTSTAINLTGVGTPGTPAITVSPAALGFGNQTINTTSASMMFSVTGTSLTAPIEVTAPAGFQIRTGTNAYSQSLSLTPTNGSVNITVDVVFTPTAAQNYVDNITLTSTNATTRNVSVSGTGVLPPASLAVTPTQLNFTAVQVGQVSSPQSFTVTGDNLTANVSVVAPTGFLIRQGTSGTFVQNITLVPSGNAVNTTVQVQFTPTAEGSYDSNIALSSSGNGGANASVRVTGTANPTPTGPFIVANPTSLNFETVSSTGSAQILTFSINAGNLVDDLILTGSNAAIVFRDASAGGDFVNGPLRITPVKGSGTVSLRTIEVRLTGPIAQGEFTGSITASSQNATPVVVSITANSTGGESVVNVSSSALNLFSTVPGVPSAVQSYQLSGTNLLRDITVTAPPSFQISLNADFTGITTTGNTLTVSRDANSGDVSSVTVYVRFLPSSAFSTSANVLNSSSPALGVAVRVSGTSEPSVQLLNAFQEVKNIVINTRSAAQTITVRAERVLQPVTIAQLLSANATFNPNGNQQFEFSRDNVNFTSDTIKLRPNTTTYSINRQIYVRYRPTNLGSAQSTLQFQSNDFDNKGVQSFSANALLSGLPIDTQPTLRSGVTVVRNGTAATVTFALPANYAAQGYGEGRLIVASENPVLPGGDQPKDGISYQTGNQNYGSGPQVAPGYFAVFAGPNASVTITGLDIRKTYYFYTFEFNNIDNVVQVIASGAENYLSPPDQEIIPGIIAPSPLPVTLVSFDAKVRGNRVALTWATASELNNKGFEVQRGSSATTFETILSRDGKGTTTTGATYSATDENPLVGTSYYRLKQVDLDGTTTFSKPVAVTFLKSGDLTMFPNPVENDLSIEVAGTAARMQATITDLSGRVVRTQVLNAGDKLRMSDLQAGTYLVTIGEGATKVTRRIVKK